jgi:two-component system LytT family sensor kinase
MSKDAGGSLDPMTSGVETSWVVDGTPGVTAAVPSVADSVPLPSLLRHATTWRLLGWWTVAYGLSSWIIEYLFSRLDPAASITFAFAFNRVVYATVWSGAIVVAILATERFPVTSTKQVGRIAIHLAVCLIVTILWGIIAYYGCVLLVPGWKPLGIARMLASTSKNVLFGYGLVIVLVHITLRVRVHRNQEVALLRQAHLTAQAQLQILKLEMQPHFLFNALHSVSALIESDPVAANDTLALVSDMLRHAVATARVQEVSLREELATLRLYTQIQQVRFGDRLHLTWAIDESTVDAAVPHMLLQPLVENAIKHGVEAHSNAGQILIAAHREGNALRLMIRDDGPGFKPPSPRSGPGVGIANVRSRLEQLYGAKHSFNVGNAPRGGTQVTIRIPFESATKEKIDPQPASSKVEIRPAESRARQVRVDSESEVRPMRVTALADKLSRSAGSVDDDRPSAEAC